jgi:DNA-directed RNA polymerase subunit alpha
MDREKRVWELDLLRRTATALRLADIEYVWQLVEYTEADLMKIRGFGPRALENVRELLSELGLSLRKS